MSASSIGPNVPDVSNVTEVTGARASGYNESMTRFLFGSSEALAFSAVALVLSLGATSCSSKSDPAVSDANGGDGGTGTSAGSDGSTTPVNVTVTAATLLHSMVTVGTTVRTYETSIPAGYSSSNPLPLILVFHGDGGTGDEIRKAVPIEASANGGAIFLYPDGQNQTWDLDDPADSNPDVAFFDAMLTATAGTYPFDAKRVFVAGFSRGAYFANQMGCRRGGTIRALASYEGGGPYEDNPNGKYDSNGQLICSGSSQQVGAFIVQADDDTVVALSEGQKSLAHWSYESSCSMTEEQTAPSPCVTWNGCSPLVVWCEIPSSVGLGHNVWPSAPAATWSFFSTFK